MPTTISCSNRDDCLGVRGGKECRSSCLAGRGSDSPDLLVVGEYPSWEDDSQGIAFSGQGFDLINTMLKKAGFSLDKVRYSLATRCKLPNNLPPPTKQVNMCRSNLEEEIRRHRPKLIIPMGNISCKSVLNKAGIRGLRGIPSTVSLGGRDFQVMPTFSVGLVLRDPTMQAYIEQDLVRAHSLIYGEEVPLADTAYTIISSPDVAATLLKDLAKLPENTLVAMDIEANSVNTASKDYKVLSIALCSEEKKAVCVLFNKISTRKFLSRLFGLKNLKYIFHNGMYDVSGIRRFTSNFVHKRWAHDTILMAAVLDENAAHGLKNLTAIHIPEMAGYETAVNSGVEANGWAGVDPLTLAKYNCTDADMTLRLFHLFQSQIKEQGLEYVYGKVMMGGIRVLQEISSNGLCMDIDLAKVLTKKYEKISNSMLATIQGYPAVKKLIKILAQEKMDKYNAVHKNAKTIEAFLEPFNPSSSVQKSKLLFDLLGYKAVKMSKTSGAASTDRSVLEEYAKKDKLCRKLIEYGRIQKLLGTYIRPVEPDWLNTFDGRSHSSYKLHVTTTGRTSSSSPNHENIPRPDTNPDIRKMFIASPGCVLLEADFSQLELRLAAMYGDDPVMKKAFTNGQDVHKILASKFYKIPIEEITKEQRTAAKKTNFGVLYGMESKRLAEELGVSEKVAQGLIDTFFTTFSGIKRWVGATRLFAMQHKYVVSHFGRRRRIPAIASADRGLRMEAERQAVNAPIQGLGSDLMMLSLVRISNFLRKNTEYGARLVATVHDSVVVEVKEEYAINLAKIVLKIMSNFNFDWMHGIPIEAEVKIGKNWAEMVVYSE